MWLLFLGVSFAVHKSSADRRKPGTVAAEDSV